VSFGRSMERDASLSGSKWDDILEKGDGPLVVTASVPIRQVVPAALAAYRAGTSFALKAKWLGDNVIGATSYHNSMWVEGIAAQYTDQTTGNLANTRRIGLDTTVRLATAGTGSSVKVTVVNSVASYA
jgi:outer membrane translocation and assembly module TamA